MFFDQTALASVAFTGKFPRTGWKPVSQGKCRGGSVAGEVSRGECHRESRSRPTAMTELASKEMWQIFDARRVKAPELKGLDAMANVLWGWFKNRQPVLSQLKALAARVETYEPAIQKMGTAEFYETLSETRDLA